MSDDDSGSPASHVGLAPIRLVLQDEDLTRTELSQLRASASGVEVLGDGERQAIDILPRALVRRLEGIIPSDFELTEVVLKVQLSGMPAGIGVSGEAMVKLQRRHTAPKEVSGS